MSAKIVAAMAAAVLLGTTALASAQAQHQQRHRPRVSPPPYGTTWRDPYAGTYYENVAPYGSSGMRDPYYGTPFQGVAPY